MRVGDVIETGMWVTGDDDPKLLERYDSDVKEAFDYFIGSQGFTYGEVKKYEKHPMDDRVGEVPDHIQGSRVRLLVYETEVTGRRIENTGSFIGNLELSDLKRLRGIIRKCAKRQVSNKECDMIIEEVGPEAAVEAMRNG